jgi:predicted nucleotidyltransferase
MNNILFDISGKIDPERVSVLRSIKEVAQELDIPFFLVGAFARDVIFEQLHQIPAPRATQDIDLGVEVANWEEFQRLTGELIEHGIVTATKIPHRFVANPYGIVVDILPYGGIAGEAKRISWPPDRETNMTMLGFEDAYKSALRVRFGNEPVLEILVASPAALALLKIISWADAKRERDAQDLFFILENYDATGIEAQLYESHVALLTEEGYDARLASLRLLGRDITELCSSETVKTVTEILTQETDEDQGFRMLAHMIKGTSFRGVKFEATLQLLKKLLQGIQEEMSRD